MKKKILSMLALLCLTVSSAWAQGPWTSGDCTLTLSNGTMTVSGNGAMADYASEEDRPWHDYSSNITSLVVESGVTTIGSRAFYNFMALTSVTLPEGLTTINVRTFYGCSGLTTLTIPSTVTIINSNDAFYICTSMTDVYLYADPANLTWPEDGDDFKDNNATKCHVLAEHLAAYQSNFSAVNVTFVGDLQPQAPAGPEVTWNAATKTGTFLMPGYDVEMEVAYFNITAPTANTTDGDIHAGTTTPLINAGATTEEGATIKYLVTATNEQPTSTDGFSADVPTAEAITAPGTYYVWYYLDFATGDDSDISAQAIQVTVADYLDYTVSLAKGTEDAGKWDIEPTEAKPGTEIKATYSGTKRVKSVKAVKKPEPKLDLATVTADTTVEDGYTVTGTLGANVKISIADGATVTLDGVTISNGQIACSGNATIILMGTNSVTGASNQAAIKIGGSGTTLTITGSGSLTATGGNYGAGIGTDRNGSGGNIVINGGTVTATGGYYGAGIGTGNAQGSSITCGDITINGGRVTAQGGERAAGIGTGMSSSGMMESSASNTCGAITIGTGVTMVTATKGSGSSAHNSIGKGNAGYYDTQACGTITIGGDATTYAAGVTTSPFTYPAP